MVSGATSTRCITGRLSAARSSNRKEARARLEPGKTTRWHRLAGTVERYVIVQGRGRAEIGSLPPAEVSAGDVVLIPPGCRQRITNTGTDDLIFLAICTPRFSYDAYQDIDDQPDEL